jgi:hypothetical protein
MARQQELALGNRSQSAVQTNDRVSIRFPANSIYFQIHGPLF